MIEMNVMRRSCKNHAFSLIEVLVAVTLMSVIVLGLLAMFSEVQRAFRTGITQVDIMESGRSGMELVSREIEQTTPTRQTESANFYAAWNGYALVQALPGKDPAGNNQSRTNVLQDVLFTTRENQTWLGVGYRVVFNQSSVGTLCRYVVGSSALDPAAIASLDSFTFRSSSNRIADGVVHFRVLAYDAVGNLITPYDIAPRINYVVPFGITDQIGVSNQVPANLSYEYHFRSNAVPAYVDIELGILEQKTVEKTRGLVFNPGLSPSDPNQPQIRYLEKQAGRVHVFRQRVPIRNVDPTVYQ